MYQIHEHAHELTREQKYTVKTRCGELMKYIVMCTKTYYYYYYIVEKRSVLLPTNGLRDMQLTHVILVVKTAMNP